MVRIMNVTNPLREVVLETEEIRLTLLPEIGCKITKLEFLRCDFEWLWQDSNRPVRKPAYCDDYSSYDISGFDECFPNIGLSNYPHDPNVTLCDHGEIWAKPWQVTVENNHLSGSVELTAMPLMFEREISLNRDTIEFNYRVTNNGNKSFDYMWSAHPLFKLPNRYRVLLPSGQKMYKEFGFGGRIGSDGDDGYQGHLKELTWPIVESAIGESVDLSIVIPTLGVTDKVVVTTSELEKLTLINDDLAAGLEFTFSSEVSHVGICSNLTAWPPGPHPATWIAIEPMIGISDSLDENIALGASRTIQPGEIQTWNFAITLTELEKD